MKNKEKTRISKMASEMGKLGGKALVKKRGKDYMKKIGQNGAKARWGNNLNINK